MYMKFLSFFMAFCFCLNSFAIDCSDNNGFIKVDGATLGIGMYNTNGYVNKIKDKRIGGEWEAKNMDSNDFYISGVSRCLTSDSNSNYYNKQGKFCWCKINVIDNYRVDSNWKFVNEYYKPVDDEKKQDEENKKLCMEECPWYCLNNINRTIKEVNGYYACDKVLYKIENPSCGGFTFFKKVKGIKVFNSKAEILYEDHVAVLNKDENGFYINDDTKLMLSDNKLFMGSKIISNLEECN